MTLSETIISLVPDIVELKFGCKIRVLSKSAMADEVVRKFGERLYWLGGDSTKWYCSKGWIDYKMFLELQRKESIEILGRPITFADVLRAIGEKITTTAKGTPVIPIRTAKVLFMWNLSTGLDGQSEPTKAFLRTLLGANEG